MAWVQTARPRTATAFAEVARAPSLPADGSWAHPEAGLRVSAYGAVDVREGASLLAVLENLDIPLGLPARVPGPWFGAAAFSGALGPDWEGFSPLRFTLPGLLAWREGGRHHLAAFGEGARQRLDAARAKIEGLHVGTLAAAARVRVRHRRGERARWNALVSRALEAIEAGALDKVVLARAIDVEADAPLDAEALLRALEARYPTCRSFLVRGSGGVFLGEHEALDRGRYAGVVGWVGEGRAELAMALRSALIRGRRARIFVGAGIVDGSSPDAEWEETELKARALLEALGAPP